MSYCRWSSDDFRCDLYAYEHCDGFFTVHVASNRYDEGYPKSVPKACFKDGFYKYGVDAEADRLYQEHEADQMAHLHPIDLPHAGETFNLATLAELRDKMRELQALGYHVPEYTFTRIEEELAENANN